MTTPQHKDTTLDEYDLLDQLIKDSAIALCCNDCEGGGYDYENTKNCATCNGTGLTEWQNDYLIKKIIQWRDMAVVEAVYGSHEYIMGKNIIQNETDQTFNYARLHKAIDDYIATLKETPNED